jgi:hypothetical protein
LNHYFGAIEIAKAIRAMLGGKGKVAIVNAPPGVIIRNRRTNGFVDGMKKSFPHIKIIADRVADWDRKKAQDVLTTILISGSRQGLRCERFTGTRCQAPSWLKNIEFRTKYAIKCDNIGLTFAASAGEMWAARRDATANHFLCLLRLEP